MEKVSNVADEMNMDNGLCEMLRHGVTAFHVVEHTRKALLDAGFEELPFAESWHVKQGGSYVICPFPSMLIAVHVGTMNDRSMVRIATAHTDSPCLKVKFHAELPGKQYAQINVEPYGGLLPKTWFDRPLSVAGKLVLRGTDAFHPITRLVDSKRPICVIPSLAPHLAKGSDAKELNVQKEMMPIVGFEYKDADNGFLLRYLCEEFKITKEELLDYDLYLYNPEQPERVGLHEVMISAPRIDNLASVAALLEAMKGTVGKASSNIMIAAMFDNEEIGSRSKQGADSVMLPQIIEKLGRSLIEDMNSDTIQENRLDMDRWKDMVAQGFLLSMDGAQGYHPNYSETSDPTNPVYLGQGIVIKTSASQRYLSDSEASSVIKSLCEERKLPWQQQVNRSGMPGGQTLGPILAAVLPLQGADVGIPMLAMHSARELAAWKDYRALVELAEVFFMYES